ncbi:MAG: hypothetical protein DRR42_08005 [Gammaproteobacteria bacterium]|nr:MAG: hypothetical protein DRR42_08005 [Gammaproteobacteria bacterium]
MTRKLIIHIGNHKTGTSSIQNTLFLNKAALLRQGFTLFNRNPDGSEKKSSETKKGNSSRWVKYHVNQDEAPQGRIKKTLPEALCTAGDNVIISAEALSWMFDVRKIDKFQKHLSKYFGDIKIVAYIRRQDIQAVSHHQQACKRSSVAARWFYGGGPMALPAYKDHFQNYLNYHHRLGLWADCFGEENLISRIFERGHLDNGDPVDDFFHVTGLENEIGPTLLNNSKGFEKAKIGHLISQQDFSQAEWTILTEYLDNSGKLLPSRDQAIAFYEHFKHSNELLNKRFSLNDKHSLFEEDFSQYPNEAGDEWSEATANRAINNLLKGARDLPSFEEQDIEVMHHCARLLKTVDAYSSSRMLSILKKYSPGRETPSGGINVDASLEQGKFLKMKTIYLHVGNFKAGTSAIQKFCSEHRGNLLDCGFDYIKSARPSSNITNHGKIPLSLLRKYGGHLPYWYDDKDMFADVSKKVRSEINNSHCSNIIISSEEFYRIAGNKKHIMESAGPDLQKLFRGHQVKIIMYVREPLEMLKSWYNQASKSNKPLPRFTDFFYRLNNSILLPQRNTKFWRSYFGKNCLIIEPYSLSGAEHIHRFLDLMRADMAPGITPQNSVINTKRSEDTLEPDRISKIMLLRDKAERDEFLDSFTFKNSTNTKQVEEKIDFINRRFQVFCQEEGLDFANASFTLFDLITHENTVNRNDIVAPSHLRRGLAQLRDSELYGFMKKIRKTFR